MPGQPLSQALGAGQGARLIKVGPDHFIGLLGMHPFGDANTSDPIEPKGLIADQHPRRQTASPFMSVTAAGHCLPPGLTND